MLIAMELKNIEKIVLSHVFCFLLTIQKTEKAMQPSKRPRDDDEDRQCLRCVKQENVLFPYDVWTVVLSFLDPKAVLACAATSRSVALSAMSANVWTVLDIQHHWCSGYANSMFFMEQTAQWHVLQRQFAEEQKGCHHPLDVFRAKTEYEKKERDKYQIYPDTFQALES